MTRGERLAITIRIANRSRLSSFDNPACLLSRGLQIESDRIHMEEHKESYLNNLCKAHD
jgi:hypothetical protein